MNFNWFRLSSFLYEEQQFVLSLRHVRDPQFFCAIQAHYQEEISMENPKLPPILLNKAGSVYYVYTYKNVWDREL